MTFSLVLKQAVDAYWLAFINCHFYFFQLRVLAGAVVQHTKRTLSGTVMRSQ